MNPGSINFGKLIDSKGNTSAQSIQQIRIKEYLMKVSTLKQANPKKPQADLNMNTLINPKPDFLNSKSNIDELINRISQ